MPRGKFVVAAVTTYRSPTLHADLRCIRRLGAAIVVDARAAIDAGRRICRHCWSPSGYVPTPEPEAWELEGADEREPALAAS